MLQLDIPNSIISDNLNSMAFAYNGIVLFNNFVERDSKIKAIEFYSNSGLISFQLSVVVFNFNYKT